MWFVQSVIAYLLCASPCPLLLWGVFTGRICLLLLFQCDGICPFMVPLPQTKCKSAILLRSARTGGRRCADTAESIGLWNQTDARPLGEMRFYAFSQYEREKWFRLPLSPHPLFSPTPPQVLTPFNVQLLTDTKTALHCTRAILLCSSDGFYLG